MKKLLSEDGSIFLSVPNSPTSWEAFGWTRLNLPPHHLTRWNERSLERLASEIGMRAEIKTDLYALRGIKSLFWHFLNLTGGAAGRFSEVVRVSVHPHKFLKLIVFALSRERDGTGQRQGDIALARFRYASTAAP